MNPVTANLALIRARLNTPFARAFAFTLAALSLFGLCTHSFALDADRSQSITITADFAELNEGAGTATYQGEVELKQGSLQIFSDRIVVFTDEEQKVRKVVATGTPASFSQKLRTDKPAVVAQANDIEYQPLANKLILSHQAALTQGENRFEGERIEYDIERQILNAQGNTGTADTKQRVKMVLPPPTE